MDTALSDGRPRRRGRRRRGRAPGGPARRSSGAAGLCVALWRCLAGRGRGTSAAAAGARAFHFPHQDQGPDLKPLQRGRPAAAELRASRRVRGLPCDLGLPTDSRRQRCQPVPLRHSTCQSRCVRLPAVERWKCDSGSTRPGRHRLVMRPHGLSSPASGGRGTFRCVKSSILARFARPRECRVVAHEAECTWLGRDRIASGSEQTQAQGVQLSVAGAHFVGVCQNPPGPLGREPCDIGGDPKQEQRILGV
mmetsp:Transcript_45072/g.143850  ORF Transcript_45072/g.143850 Transcript_45072/m.143850 type:complete len:250 (-) Transcript_45072:726-1475(-)